MRNLDVDSLLTDITLEGNIDSCDNAFFENTERVKGLSKRNLRHFYLLLVKSSILFLLENFRNKLMEWLWVLL